MPAVAPPASSELTPEDPYETVFEEAATPPFEGVPDTADELNLPLPPPPGPNAPRRTSPDSSVADPTAARPPCGRGAR